jgi:hypothetical protein
VLSQSILLVEFEVMMMIIQQLKYNRIAEIMTMEFSTEQPKDIKRRTNPTPNQG